MVSNWLIDLKPFLVRRNMSAEKHATASSSTVPVCSHLVQKPAAEVEVHVEVEAMLNLAEYVKVSRRARRRRMI